MAIATPHIRSDLDRRIELVSMDRVLDEITIGLYLVRDGTAATLHSYSRHPGVPERLSWLTGAMCSLGGMEPAGADGRTVAFSCDIWHELAARRAFLEACKLDPSTVLVPRPSELYDLRTGQHVAVVSLGEGRYQVDATPIDPGSPAPGHDRAAQVAAGLAKLAALELDPNDASMVGFTCRAPHDALVTLLLPRAINVRAVLREQEMTASRGLLVAPSAQASGS